MWEFFAEAFPPGFNSYGIAWCFTAVSSQVKQKQWWTTPLLKMLEIESLGSSPLL
jgi:hypothetical protein